MSSSTNQYVRQVLHYAEAPPPVEARFFYASNLPIDDPLSPVPPPIASGSARAKVPPKPFSEYDNAALEKAWHELRRKTLEYNEQRGEKKGSGDERSRTRAGSNSSRDGKKRADSVGSGTPRGKPVKIGGSSLSHVDGPTDEEYEEMVTDTFDGPSSATEISGLSNTTGTPFIRAPSRTKLPPTQQEERPARPRFQAHDTYLWDDPSHLAKHSPPPEKRTKKSAPKAKVAVGVSRLHHVEMPDLKMTPIYWEPVQDTAQVMRSTWFYQETMMPVEANVSNMLEAGYLDLQVWTQTWKDEINSALIVGAEGEERLVHKLWPEKLFKPNEESRPSSRQASVRRDGHGLAQTISNMIEPQRDTPEEARAKILETACDIIDVCNGPDGCDNKASGSLTDVGQGLMRSYAAYGVIYANDKEARLLKPSLLPSAYYGRRPLANYIRKGHKLGVPVVRGFNSAIWEKLHPTKSSPKTNRAEHGVATSASGTPPNARSKTDPNLAKSDHPQVTDLILVVHGIGQKLSRRMESWHFTHAMNAFRREVHVEAGTKDVKCHFRPDMGGIMVLPVNWRHALSFEEGGYRDGEDDPTATRNEFTLNDITPDTLPSVRNIVSDVMLDIPYYMSHHQPKMIAAVIREANRVYTTWCANNPGFSSTGRVHIIAHSLGSVMAVDILSKQPTVIPPHLSDPTNLPPDTPEIPHFLFDTHNLFLAGSPAGFFLLLKRAQLKPRLNHPSHAARADPGSNNLSVCGEQDDYGCLAVHNIYNVINGYDPVAYGLNATVDAGYAAALKPAAIPSAAAGWFGGPSSSSREPPPAVPQRMPSNMELETHNFTHEAVAEARMRRLNDSGQLDFAVRYGGSLAIPFLSMLSAHSSYWLLRDFVRMVVVETGRKDGSEGVLKGMRAVKKPIEVGKGKGKK